MNTTQAPSTMGMLGMNQEKPGGSPNRQSLAMMLSDKRVKMLAELRDIEQALEALEHTPDFEPTFQRVLKILQRSY